MAVAASAAAFAGGAWAGEARVTAHVDWTRAPSFSDVAAAYPAAARTKGKDGEVVLGCATGPEGRLDECRVISESPRGLGFGGAARGLAAKFLGPAGSRAQVRFRFSSERLDAQTVERPEWVGLPTPAAFQSAFPDAASKAGVLKARAVMSCTVDPTGGLTACEGVGEEPAGYGFAHATLPLAPAFRLRIWGEDGLPVVGGKVRVPIRYDMQQAGPSAETRP